MLKHEIKEIAFHLLLTRDITLFILIHFREFKSKY